MAKISRDVWIGLLIFGGAFGVRLLLAMQLPFPQLDDPAGYIQLARNIVIGRGLVSDVLWSYWVSFPTVTHPSNEFWMPLASVIMAGSIRLFGDSLLAAELPGMVAGSLLAPLTYGMGRAVWPGQRRWSVLASLFVIFSAALTYQAVSADSSAIYMLIATLAILAGAYAIDRCSLKWAVVSGVLCSLSYLTRSHGLLLPASIGLIALLRLRHEPRRVVSLVSALAIGFVPLVALWWWRNVQVFGTTQPIPLTTIMAAHGYEEWFNYTDQPTVASMLAMGASEIIRLRVDALASMLIMLAKMTFLVGLVGLPVALVRHETSFRIFTVYTTALYLGVCLVLPSAALTGSFYHSAGVVVIWSALGGVMVIKRLVAQPRTHYSGVALGALFIGLCLGQSILAASNEIAVSRQQGQQFAGIAAWVKAHLPEGEPIITTQANTLNYVSGHPALTLPMAQGPADLRQLAYRYSVRYIVITERTGLYPAALDDPALGAKVIGALPETSIYELER